MADPAIWRDRWTLPDAVQVVEFVSDLHLCPEMPHTREGFERYLASTRADAVLLLGDVFEAWVGDDVIAAQPFERECVAALARLSQRSLLGVMCGNRDFLFGPGLLVACGATGLADPCVLEAFGQRILLSHGDALCLADQAYQQVRRLIRDPKWQASFLARPLDERLAMAKAMRAQSQAQQAHLTPESYADIDPELANQWLRAADSTTLVHGHTHRPGTQHLPGGTLRHVLSDWDLDTSDESAQRAEVLRWTAQGISRHPLADYTTA